MKGSYEITNLTALKMRLSCARKTNQNLDENMLTRSASKDATRSSSTKVLRSAIMPSTPRSSTKNLRLAIMPSTPSSLIKNTSTPRTGKKRPATDTSVTRSTRSSKQPKQHDDSIESKMGTCSLHDHSPNDSSESFQTAKENSPEKMNVTSEFEVTFEETEGKSILSKSAFDLQVDYEELEELPEQFDYRGVRLRENVFIGYEEQKSSLDFLIKTAIDRGESGTVLVFGGQGSGKTSFVNTCLKESESADGCKILRLSGLIHGNDVSTIHHIAKFFGIDFNDLPRIMEKVKEDCKKQIRPTIIVLDEFEVFCSRNQFLLYNFFDLLQYVGHILVIGITSRYDCIELLEKRVKSRMNHKTIVMKPPFESLGQYLDFARKLLDTDVKFTKQFQHNLEIQFSKSHSIARLKMCLLKNMRSKHASELVRGPVQTYLTGRDDKVSLICNCLTHLEIAVLLLAGRLVYLKERERFNCNALCELIEEIPKQFGISHNQKLLFMTVGTLIGYDLIVIEERKSLQNKKLWLTEWTPLVLNVFKFQIEESLKRLQKKLSTDVQQLFSVNR